MKNVEKFSTKQQIKKLEDRVNYLENKLEVVAEHGYDPKGKWEYKGEGDSDDEDDDDDDDGGLMDTVVGILGKPWEVAFKVTIPACARNDYQDWEEKPTLFKDIPEIYQKQIIKKAAKEGKDAPAAE